MFLERLLNRKEPSSPAFLDGANAEAGTTPTARRRERVAGSGEDMLMQALSAKILHGWLQNRHQTLYPLTLNFRNLRLDQGRVTARFAAASLLCTCPADGAATTGARVRAWLTSLGAGAEVLACFDDAIVDTPPLHVLLDGVMALDMTVYGYVAALVGIDIQRPASARYLDFLQARFDLPTTIVRSALRKFQK